MGASQSSHRVSDQRDRLRGPARATSLPAKMRRAMSSNSGCLHSSSQAFRWFVAAMPHSSTIFLIRIENGDFEKDVLALITVVRDLIEGAPRWGSA
jgi:hypothetical protein